MLVIYRTNNGGGASSSDIENTTDIDTHSADILNSLAAFG